MEELLNELRKLNEEELQDAIEFIKVYLQLTPVVKNLISYGLSLHQDITDGKVSDGELVSVYYLICGLRKTLKEEVDKRGLKLEDYSQYLDFSKL